MSDNELSVNTDAALAAAPALYDLADRLDSAVGGLTNGLSELGTPWGEDDATARAFVAQYQEPADQAIMAGKDASSVLRSTADGVVTMAKGFDATEQENKASIQVAGDDPASEPRTSGSADRP